MKWERRLEDKRLAHKMTERNESRRLVREVMTPQRGEVK